jgi:hypothetical protein
MKVRIYGLLPKAKMAGAFGPNVQVPTNFLKFSDQLSSLLHCISTL